MKKVGFERIYRIDFDKPRRYKVIKVEESEIADAFYEIDKILKQRESYIVNIKNQSSNKCETYFINDRKGNAGWYRGHLNPSVVMSGILYPQLNIKVYGNVPDVSDYYSCVLNEEEYPIMLSMFSNGRRMKDEYIFYDEKHSTQYGIQCNDKAYAYAYAFTERERVGLQKELGDNNYIAVGISKCTFEKENIKSFTYAYIGSNTIQTIVSENYYYSRDGETLSRCEFKSYALKASPLGYIINELGEKLNIVGRYLEQQKNDIYTLNYNEKQEVISYKIRSEALNEYAEKTVALKKPRKLVYNSSLLKDVQIK